MSRLSHLLTVIFQETQQKEKYKGKMKKDGEKNIVVGSYEKEQDNLKCLVNYKIMKYKNVRNLVKYLPWYWLVILLETIP